ncbi:MAG TPA: type I pullulanase [Candidatus Fimiplasma intestinipullorum]|uniref:Type I pullulanase n=1 Tax=Candidatus Fimiplasma intestinipullorum TaxID=2840825 RepID=A0A9D1HPQ3_9FIRM|nr:type I pullulanase [Candidatus Fimiplasma intestinipullorum]
MNRDNEKLKAYLDDYHLISVYLSKYYYEGKSSVFRLRDNKHGTLQELQIQSMYESRNGSYITYKLHVPMDLVIGYEYDILDAYGLSCPLIYGRIVRLPEFDMQFSCMDTPLGAQYSKEKTTFRLWAPPATKAVVEYTLGQQTHWVYMNRTVKGTFECDVEGDLDGARYTYIVKNSMDWQQATDPYAVSSTANSKESVVINPAKVRMDLKKDQLPPLDKYTDAVIYEMSIRDFTWMRESGVKHRGKFLGLTETGTRSPQGGMTGLDYLVDLGVTHVQIMPMFDFATVDENHPDVYYNWGYDPLQYNVPEGSYATDPNDGYKRVLELKQMIRTLHEHGLRVIMDVVYNHMYDRMMSSFDKIVPNYFFRLGPNGENSNGSFCGNDMATNRPMVRKFIVESCLHWLKEYGVDGFRFDLMGIIDVDTMNRIVYQCRAIDPNFMIYGEGWNMPTILDEKLKACIANRTRLPHVAFFNDYFRDKIRGSHDVSNFHEKGFAGGNTYLLHEAKLAMQGYDYLDDPWRSINYVECHDNATVWDKIKVSNSGEDREKLLQRINLINGIVILSQGVPFLHSGQEFAVTKRGEHNTYNRPDSINQIDWVRKDYHLAQVNYVRDMIQIRKQYPCLRLETKEEVQYYLETSEIDYRMILFVYHMDMEGYNQLQIYVNPSDNIYPVFLGDGEYELIADQRGSVNQKLSDNNVKIAPVSIAIFARIDQ